MPGDKLIVLALVLQVGAALESGPGSKVGSTLGDHPRGVGGEHRVTELLRDTDLVQRAPLVGFPQGTDLEVGDRRPVLAGDLRAVRVLRVQRLVEQVEVTYGVVVDSGGTVRPGCAGAVSFDPADAERDVQCLTGETGSGQNIAGV